MRHILGVSWGLLTALMAVIAVVVWPLDMILCLLIGRRIIPLADSLMLVKAIQKVGFDELDKHFNKP